jgi:hypothetical protein
MVLVFGDSTGGPRQLAIVIMNNGKTRFNETSFISSLQYSIGAMQKDPSRGCQSLAPCHALRWMRSCPLLAACLALVAESVVMAAPQAKLVYTRESGAEPCPDEPAVRRAVAARLGYDPFVDGDGAAGMIDRTVRVTIGPSGHWLRATIELVDETGELVGAHQLAPRLRGCDALASAMELAIAIAIDPLRASAPPAPPTEPSPTPEPSPLPTPARGNASANANANANANASANTVARALRRARAPELHDSPAEDHLYDDTRVHLVGRFSILAAVGSAPAATWGLALGLAAQWRRFSLGGELRADLPGSSVSAGGTVSSSLVTVHLLPCVRAYGFFFCGLLSAGMVIAYGSEFPVDRRVVLPFFGGGARTGVELKLGRALGLGLAADLLAPFTRARLQLDDQTLFHAQPVSGAFSLFVSGALK